MTPEQLEILAHYRSLWNDINAAQDIRSKLDEHIRDLQRQQRALANKIASLGNPEYR